MTSEPLTYHLRPAREDDRAWILSLAPRLGEFPLPPWRTKAEIGGGEGRTLMAAIPTPPEGCALLVAEEPGRGPRGFIYLETHTDYFTHRPYAHIGVLAVDPAAEGRGVARRLVAAGEEWARARGFDRITLNVFDGNMRARGLYERLGYAVETLHYLKPL